jgi:hypothetical protein
MDRKLSDLIGTARDYFMLAVVRLKNSTGVLEVRNEGDTAYANANVHTLGVAGSNASNKVTLTAPAGLSGSVSLTLPPDAGTDGWLLKTNGSGTLTWVAPGSNAAVMQVESFTQATSSPLTIIAPADDSVVSRVIIVVDSAASAGSPTISVGISGDTDRDMLTTDSNLLAVGIYEVAPMTDVGTDPDDIIATIVPNGQTFSGRVYVEITVPA